MRSISSTVALVATAALLVCATPALAKGKKSPPPMFDGFSQMFKGNPFSFGQKGGGSYG